MEADAARAEVRAFVVENFMLGADPAELDDDASLLDNGVIDSTGVMELVAFLEEGFGISVEDSELVPENLDSVNLLIGYLERKGPGADAVRVSVGEASHASP
jgi:acyl carrier protein